MSYFHEHATHCIFTPHTVALYCIVYVLVFWRHHLSYGRLFMNGMRTMNYKRLLVFRVR